nr:phosphatidate cytidylyltransferase [Thermoleophilaceae bacterium]
PRDRSDRPARPRSRRRRRGGDTSARVWAAIPAILFAIFITAQGGLIFALGLIALGLIAMHELYTMMARGRPVNIAGFIAMAALVLAALYGDQDQMVLVLVAALPLTFFFAVLRPRRDNVTWSLAATIFGVAWIGMAIAHMVLVRELPHGGGLVLDIAIGTFIADTAAYFGGRAYGSRQIAPLISPNKTVEGFIAGTIGGTFAFWLFAVAYQHDWFAGPEALLIGFCVAIAAPIGDLFESLVKRDLDVKDTGRFFGAHGGVLDRLDGLFFSSVVGYYVASAVLGY